MLKATSLKDFRKDARVWVVRALILTMVSSMAGVLGARITKAAGSPSIISYSTNTGPDTGGTAIDFTTSGNDFGAQIYVDGIPVATVNNPGTDMHIVTPPHAAGPVSMWIRNSDASVSPSVGFTYTGGSPAGCYDIVGQGKQVLVPDPGGVANSGVVNFDPVAGNPLPQYEACVIDPDDDPTVGVFELRGWAWNDNLGWISFYCPPGIGATNSGIACSNAAYTGGYGVTVDPVTGTFSGYAWGDNAGWISFDNPGFSTVSVDATNPKCQGYVYSTIVPDPSCPAHTKAYTAAWSDNVGWFDFDGIIIPWYSLIKEINEAGVQVTLTPDPSTMTMIDPLVPVANNSDVYTLRLHVQDKKGNPIDTGGRYTITATPEWLTDTVKKKQTHGEADLGGPACPGGALQNAVTKPCLATDMVSEGAGTGNLSATIKSMAPTSSMNGWDKDADGLKDFSYETFMLPSSKAVPLQDNTLQLDQVVVSIIDNDTGGACVYGTGPTCAGKGKVPTFAVGGYNRYLHFKPQTNIPTLEDHKGNTDFIDISSFTLWPFPTTITGPGTVTFTAGIDPVPSPEDYAFLFDDGDGVLKNPGDTPTVTRTSGSTPLSAGLGAVIDPVTKAAKSIPPYVQGLYLYSEVSEGGGDVKYYSNKFPKTMLSVAVAPVAVLRGNVYSSGATAIATSQAVRTLGDVSTNVLRDTIFRNVSKILSGVPKSAAGTIQVNSDGSGGFAKVSGTGNFEKLLPDGAGKDKVYYHYGDMDLTGPSNITWTGERTIIVVGGSVYIKKNLYNASAATAKPKLGLIVLKDLTDTAANQAKQGHVYITPDVTNIQANIFADGSVFSWVSAALTPLNGQGEPMYASVEDQEGKLKYSQLFIEGSIASQNTVGGSAQDKPITGTGVAAATLWQSRLYDLNYLRYYVGVVKRDGFGVPYCGNPPAPVVLKEDVKLVKPLDGSPWTVYDLPVGGCLFSPLDPASGVTGTYIGATGLDAMKDLGATYIYFDPPTPTLPGFGTEGGGVQQQLPQ